MLMLRDIVEKNAKVIKKRPQLRKPFLKYLEDPDMMDEEVVYSQFKKVLDYSFSV